MKKENIKILLMQIRQDKVTAKEEFDEFVRYSGLKNNNFSVLNVFNNPNFENNVIENHHALFIGGSSDASVLEPEKYNFIKSCENLIQFCVNKNIPVFASCFGLQLAIDALGGTVVEDRENMEMGTYEIFLTDEGKKDPLFADINNSFFAVSGHEKRGEKLPKNAILLAYSKKCPIHAFKLKNKPFYGFQFHPEIDKKDLVARIKRYKKRYLDNEESLQTILNSAAETPKSNELVKKFVDIILLK